MEKDYERSRLDRSRHPSPNPKVTLNFVTLQSLVSRLIRGGAYRLGMLLRGGERAPADGVAWPGEGLTDDGLVEARVGVVDRDFHVVGCIQFLGVLDDCGV